MTTSQVGTQVTESSSSPPPPRALRRALSLGLYFALLSVLSGFFLSRRVSAEISERSLGLGRKLDAFQELSGKVTELSWNGQDLALSTLVVEQPVERVLERFVELCNASTGSVPRELSLQLGAGERAVSLLQRALVMRDLFDDGTGSAVCLAGLGDGGLRGLVERARRFAVSWDLSELGQLRYAHLRKVGEGRTQVLLASADGSLPLRELVPADGHDAKGEDVVPGVRPAQSTRILAAHAKGTPHGLTAYRSRLSAQAVLADYGRQLVVHGYVRTATPAKKVSETGAQSDPRQVLTEAYRRGPEAFVVTSQRDEGGSLLSVVRLAELPIPQPGDALDTSRAHGRGSLGPTRDRAFE